MLTCPRCNSISVSEEYSIVQCYNRVLAAPMMTISGHARCNECGHVSLAYKVDGFFDPLASCYLSEEIKEHMEQENKLHKLVGIISSVEKDFLTNNQQ